ncbi:MAG: 1-acyl-sn-glycerol-3-phosphate acyltransferase [Planctomycetota bacterium]|nr:MAG: 1-acyl-sn-glycerol-3-phosphate acyltransferase [Planctomycetota bacterium]
MSRFPSASVEDRWHDFVRVFARLVFTLVWKVRCFGREHQPPRGGVLVVSNHQSHLDPVLIGLAVDRRMNYLARQTLFDFWLLRWVIVLMGAIPIDREGGGLAGMKETLRRLKREQMILVFPEGTRTPDGEVAELKPGFCTLARRAKVHVLPVALDGAFEAWPRSKSIPRPGTIHIVLGKALTPLEVAAIDDDETLLTEVDRRIRACHRQARASVERARGRCDR